MRCVVILSSLVCECVSVCVCAGKGMFEKKIILQCPLLDRITLGHHLIDNHNQMITLTGGFTYCLVARGQQCKVTRVG